MAHDECSGGAAGLTRAFLPAPAPNGPAGPPKLSAHDARPLGRSHRAKLGKAKLKLAIDLTREVLRVPAGYRIGITAGSDTGAVEMALWCSCSAPARPVDVLAWESFGEHWAGVADIVKELKLADVRALKAPTMASFP